MLICIASSVTFIIKNETISMDICDDDDDENSSNKKKKTDTHFLCKKILLSPFQERRTQSSHR